MYYYIIKIGGIFLGLSNIIFFILLKVLACVNSY